MKALASRFAQAYSDPVRGLAPLQRAGIAREMLNANQAARPFWEQSIDLADRLGLLPRVVEIATTDPTIAAFHARIASVYEAHLAEQAAADAAPAPPTLLDPGSPDEAALAAAYAKGRDDERRRVEGLALYHLDHTQPGPRALLAAIRSGKAAP